jgi:hypothetical protein
MLPQMIIFEEKYFFKMATMRKFWPKTPVFVVCKNYLRMKDCEKKKYFSNLDEDFSKWRPIDLKFGKLLALVLT